MHMAMIDIEEIRDEAHYRLVLAEYERVRGAAPGSELGDYLDSLLDMIDDWEDRAEGEIRRPPHW
jgi:hypothetical protein